MGHLPLPENAGNGQARTSAVERQVHYIPWTPSVRDRYKIIRVHVDISLGYSSMEKYIKGIELSQLTQVIRSSFILRKIISACVTGSVTAKVDMSLSTSMTNDTCSRVSSRPSLDCKDNKTKE